MRFFFLMLAPFLALPAFSQAELETGFGAELSLVAAISGGDSRGHKAQVVTGELSLSGSADYLLENGVKISGNLTARVQADHPARQGFAGALSLCPPTVSGCPALGGQAPRGAFSQLSAFEGDGEFRPKAQIEAAYLAIDGGWGELVFGKDQGVGQRFYEGGPSVFSLARSSDPLLDPLGTSVSRTRNDISSVAAKVSYVTPRILGVRAGASFTPDASVKGLDLDTGRRVIGVAEPDLEQTIEVGIQGSRLLREADLRVRGALTWSQASVGNVLYEDVDTVSAGLDIERDDAFRFGVSYLSSDNGGHGDYTAASAGVSVPMGEWELRATADTAKDDLIGLDGWTGTVGASTELTRKVDFTVGYRMGQTDYFDLSRARAESLDRQAVLLELRIRN